MNSPSPELCIKCGHRFPPRAHEPSWCPGCGALCSALDAPIEPLPEEPEESQETPEEKARGRAWFWRLALLGPLAAMMMALLAPHFVNTAPAWLKFWVATRELSALTLVGTLVCSAVGAAYFLTGTWPRPGTARERLGSIFVYSFLIFIVQAGATFVAASIVLRGFR